MLNGELYHNLDRHRILFHQLLEESKPPDSISQVNMLELRQVYSFHWLLQKGVNPLLDQRNGIQKLFPKLNEDFWRFRALERGA